MNTKQGRAFAAMLVCGICWVVAVPAAVAQEGDEPADVPVLNELRERLQRLERDFEALKKNQRRQVPEDEKQQRVVPMLETPYLGRYYNRRRNNRGNNNYSRYFVAKLNLLNLTPNDVEIKREDIQLVVDGTPMTMGEIPNDLLNQSFQIGNQYQQVRNLRPEKAVRIPPAAMRNTWILFVNLDDGTHVPEMTLKIQYGDKTAELDVNASQREALGMEIERIGPRGALGLVTISGTLNSINIGSLMDDLDQLTTQKVVRVVVRWAETAKAPDQQLMNWLIQNANAAYAQRSSNEQYPSLPATLREFHLCQVPQHDGSHSSRRSSSNRDGNVHGTEAEAVQAALETAFQSLPRDELLTSIEQGHQLARVAALATGGGRLGEDKLPIILRYAESDDPLLQQAAITALRHFGDPAAVEKLVHFVKKNNEPLASAAIASLAGSRYAAAHDALLQIMKNEPPAAQKNIVRVLAEHPRPIWSEAIYEFVKDPREGLNQEALQALTQVGHPKLIDVLRDALNAGDPALRNKAYKILAERTDHESEQLAMDYALKQLADENLDAATFNVTLNLLNRVKDKRAAPLLLQQFSRQSNKQALIRTLAVIGDEETADFLVEKFVGLQAHEQPEVLKALRTLNSPKFQELASRSLLSDNGSLSQSAARELYQDGSPESIQILIDALKKAGNSTTLGSVCSVLAQLATPQAREALRDARDNGDRQKRDYARNALQQMFARTPGYQYVAQARRLEQEKKIDEAIAQFTEAIKVGPEWPEPYLGRGNIYTRQEKFDKARPDFDKALELDPWNSQALTGICVAMVMQDDDVSQGIQRLENHRTKFESDAVFDYNAACVYARAVERLGKLQSNAERAAAIEKYSNQAIADLKKSVERGFRDYKWMREDPDLKSLHALPEFRKVSQMPQEGEGADDETDDPPSDDAAAEEQ